jgi:hypothetical protein
MIWRTNCILDIWVAGTDGGTEEKHPYGLMLLEV